ncbi:MAG TPA: glycosyltransferase family 4 protein [Anaerolineae bacterium]|nr:glycosyltransferase family 4 protein [Anaerolineae bacterium]HQI83588.1 glycosyltransferase family 4 protein [Anaerolineae bacterium]
MCILFLSTWFPYPPDNGSKIRAYHLLRALSQRHEVTLISFAWDTAAPEQAAAGLPFCCAVHILPRDPFARSAFAQAMRYLSLAPVVTRPIPEMQRLVGDVLTHTTFDAVIASTEVMATYALQAPGTTVKILEEHNSFSRMMEDRYRAATQPVRRLNHWISWQKTRCYEAALFRKFDQIVMVSEADRRTCEQLPGHRTPVAVIPNGVDCVHHRPGLAEVRPNTLVYNGALTYSANYDAMQYFLAEIYPRIKQQAPDVTLTITGSTRGVDLNGLRLDESVHLTGYVEDVRLPVAQSAACVVPLRQGGGTRLKILEAMALGVPVVATSKGAEGLSVVNGEHLLLADDPAAFATAVLRVLREPDLRAHLIHNARALVEAQYDWKMIGAQFVNLIETSL